MPTNPYTDYSSGADKIADVDTASAAAQNELRETTRYLIYPLEFQQSSMPGMQPATSPFESLYHQMVAKGEHDIKGEHPLSVNNEIFFVHNTAQFMAALRYMVEGQVNMHRIITGIGCPIIRGDFARWIPSNTYIYNCKFADDNNFTISLGTGAPYAGATLRFQNAEKRAFNICQNDFLYCRSATFSDAKSNFRFVLDPMRSNPIDFSINGSTTLSAGTYNECFLMKRNIIFHGCEFWGKWICRNTYSLKFYDCIFITDDSGKNGRLNFAPYDDNTNYADIWFPYVSGCRFYIRTTSGTPEGLLQFDGAIVGPIVRYNKIYNETTASLLAVGSDCLTFGAAADQKVFGIMQSNDWGGNVARVDPQINLPACSVATDPPSYTFLIWLKKATPLYHNIWNGTIA